MSSISEMLNLDNESPAMIRATHLASEDYRLHFALTKARQKSGLSIEDVAARMGTTTKHVERFERYWHDPKLSELRRYANAVGVIYSHSIDGWDDTSTDADLKSPAAPVQELANRETK